MRSTADWGIDEGYEDHRGEWRGAPRDTVEALLELLGARDRDLPPGTDGSERRVWVVTSGDRVDVPGRWHVRTEHGEETSVESTLPGDLPLGYHEMRSEDGGRSARLVVAPPACFLPDAMRGWGWAVQLPGARSQASWGIGDLADLRRLARWSAGHGASAALVSPLHAPLPTGGQQPSPYSPSSRCFRNPLYIRVEEVPGAEELGTELAAAAAAGRDLNRDRKVDRDEVWRLKRGALARVWERFGGDPAFDRYVDEQGPVLESYAAFCALTEDHGAPWTGWPDGLRHPSSPEVTAYLERERDRVRHHQWVQWLLDTQLEQAGRHVRLVHDLAVGVDAAGADAWLWQDCFATGARVGAPPDEFNTQGQDWGLPPFDPWRLREAAYEPFIRAVRAGFRHAGGMRVDHVMGLFRLFWVPPGGGPREGTYVRYPWRDLLGILALESVRAGAFVVGEDLGTVEDRVREELSARNVLSYRLVWFEQGPPSGFPERALGAVTTHDLPTVAGLWSGSDVAEQERLGLDPNVESTTEIRRRIVEWTGLDDGASPEDVVVAVHRLLADAPSALVTATLEDALAVHERPNMPGTVDERPNWSLALPSPLEEVETHELALAVTRVLREGRGAAPGAHEAEA